MIFRYELRFVAFTGPNLCLSAVILCPAFVSKNTFKTFKKLYKNPKKLKAKKCKNLGFSSPGSVPPPSGLSKGLACRTAKILDWTDWAIYSTYYAKICVGLLSLLSSYFFRRQNKVNHFGVYIKLTH